MSGLVERREGSRALSFVGGSVLVTEGYAEMVFRDDDLDWADDNPAYRVLRIPKGDYQQLGEFLSRNRRSAIEELVEALRGFETAFTFICNHHPLGPTNDRTEAGKLIDTLRVPLARLREIVEPEQ
jgi:hypothetical protein